jgi:hypothetical protein
MCDFIRIVYLLGDPFFHLNRNGYRGAPKESLHLISDHLAKAEEFESEEEENSAGSKGSHQSEKTDHDQCPSHDLAKAGAGGAI